MRLWLVIALVALTGSADAAQDKVDHFLETLPAKVNALGKESLHEGERIDRSSPIIYARSDLVIRVKEAVEVQEEPSEEERDFPWMKSEKPKEKKFKKEVRELHFSVDVKNSDAFIKDEEAFIDMGAYPAGSGALVVFPKFGKHGFPLTNLSSGVDFILMNGQGEITEVYPEIVPGALEELQSTKPCYAVLMLHAGDIESGRIKVGDVVVHKALELPRELLKMTGQTPAKKPVEQNSNSPVIFNNGGKK